MNDYDTLTNLALWERQSRVRHLQDALANCYWPDATVTTSWTSGSIADYLNADNSSSHRAEASANEVILNRSSAPIVHQNGDRAYVELPTEANHWLTVNGEEAVWSSYMQLIYRCEKRDGVWKIADMTSIFESDKLTPAIAGTNLHINPDDLKGLRHSYRWLAYTRINAGGQVSNDLLGTDRPDDIVKVYANTEAWMNQQ